MSDGRPTAAGIHPTTQAAENPDPGLSATPTHVVRPPPLPEITVAALTSGTGAAPFRPNGWLIPVAVSPWAVAAGYAGLFALIVLPGPIALILSIVAFSDLRKHPERTGRGRAVFALLTGSLATALLSIALIAGLMAKN